MKYLITIFCLVVFTVKAQQRKLTHTSEQLYWKVNELLNEGGKNLNRAEYLHLLYEVEENAENRIDEIVEYNEWESFSFIF